MAVRQSEWLSISIGTRIHTSQASSVSTFYKNHKLLRYRHSGGRTELSEHQNTGNFTENPNLILSGLGLFIFDNFRVECPNSILKSGES